MPRQTPTTTLAEAFAQQAYTAVGNRDREIMRDPYLLGFEIVEKNEDNSRIIGVFAFRVNREILMVTVFYLNGKVKGVELLYRKGVNLFTLNSEKWVSYLLSQDEDEDGMMVARSGGGNRARMHLGLGDMYTNPVGGYKRAAELPDDPAKVEVKVEVGEIEKEDEGKEGECSKEAGAAIRGWWSDLTASSPNAEATPLFRQLLVEGDLGKQAAELVERLPEFGDVIVLSGAMDLKQAGVNNPLGEAVATPEPMDIIPGSEGDFQQAAQRYNAPTAQDLDDMAALQRMLDNPNDRPDPEGAPTPVAQAPVDNRAATAAKFNAQQAAKAVPFVGPPAPGKQAGALTWYAEPQAGWPEEMVAEFYRKGYLLVDKRAAANKATAFETEGIEQRMATARGAGVMKVLDRGGKSHKVLFGPRTHFHDLDESPGTLGRGRTNDRYEMLFLDGPHKDTVYRCHDDGPGYDPLVEEPSGEAEDLEIPKGEEPKAGKCYQLWLDGKGFIGYGSFEVYDVSKSGDAVRINGNGRGGFAVLRRDLDTSDFSAGNRVFGKDVRFLPVGTVKKSDQDCCAPVCEDGPGSKSTFVPLTPKDVMFGGKKTKTASVCVTSRRGLADIMWNGERVCGELTGRQLVLKLARDLRLPVEDAEDIAFSLADGGRRELTWIAPMRKYASEEDTDLAKIAGFFFERDLDPDTDFDDGEGYDDDLGIDTRIPEQGQETYAVREVSPSPERHYLDAKGDTGFVNTRYGKGNLTSIPDEVIMQMANPGMELAQLGQQLGMTTLLDHGAVAAMTKVFDAQTFVSQYVDRMEKSLDALARVIFLLYWKPRDFAKMFGDDDLAILENKLTGVFQSYGDIVLELLQSTGDKIRK